MAYDSLDNKLATQSLVVDGAISDRSERKADVKDVVDEVFSTKNIRSKSILTQDQISIVTAALAYADMYNDTEVKALVTYLLETEISFIGKGRQNLVTIMSSMMQQPPEPQQDRNFIRKLFGL